MKFLLYLIRLRSVSAARWAIAYENEERRIAVDDFLCWLRAQPLDGGIRFYEHAKARFLREVPGASSQQYQAAMAQIAKVAGI